LKHNTPSSSYVNYELFFPMLKHLYYIYSEKARETPHLQKKEQPVDQLLFQEKVFFYYGGSKKLYNVLGVFTVIIIAKPSV